MELSRENNTHRTAPTTTWLFLFLLSLISISTTCYCFYCNSRSSGTTTLIYGPIVAVVGLVLASALVVVAARATMVAWITVLVLLAFSGMRRKVLVQHGRKITTEVAMYLAKVVVTEKGLIAVACATILSFFAVFNFQ